MVLLVAADEQLQRGFLPPTRPEDDILYQWRVRHKIEVAKAQTAPVSKVGFELVQLVLRNTCAALQCNS
jgi:hypothetical protein